eukprot:gnl/MRDRNA2_/MRDRNA2_117440_c0_seq1.p1 gnl/MRDRNA2_/MRDRNA2_117440_c0~~gnl/MRDRNA2_/MRDRNA2_117440_c0_seq1.p1  ORF type:complete len:332 (-),score=56.00 gnl/MRDRNA2_/MRDRNA2_117440_c0_seq1:556-1551(-)
MRSQLILQKMQDASFTADCGFCSVTFDSCPQNSRYAKLTIKSVALVPSEDNCRQLQDALMKVLETQIEFFGVYDFREFSLPSMRHARNFCSFIDEAQLDWSKYLKVIAMLVEDNLWASVAKGFIATLCKMCPPCCPYIICHSEDAAGQFISDLLEKKALSGGLRRTAESHTSISSFISVEDLMECCNSQMALKASESTPSTLTHDVGSSVKLYELSNGDVQVLQFRGSTDRSTNANFTGTTAGSCPKLFGSHLSFQSISSFQSIVSMDSLPHSCSREAMQQLGAAHFHVDELMLDAQEDLKELCKPLSFFNRVAIRLKNICIMLPCQCMGG